MDEREAMEGSGLVEIEDRLRPQEFAPGVRNALNYLRFFRSVVPRPCWVETALYIDRAWADESHGGLGLKDSTSLEFRTVMIQKHGTSFHIKQAITPARFNMLPVAVAENYC